MRIRSNFRGLSGWLSIGERTIRLRSMRNKQEVARRVKVLSFWEKHGEQATIDAFALSRRTLYRWRSTLAKQHGRLDALDPKSTAPTGRRRRTVLPEVVSFIIEERTLHHRLGKKKLAVLLREDGYSVSESYIGRVIDDLKERRLLPQHRKLTFYARTGLHHEINPIRRTKLRRVHKKGMELDTIVRFIDGTKRYILTAIDVERRFAFAGAYTSHSSAAAADFLERTIEVCPFTIKELQTDNGSEFALNFEQACVSLGLLHFNTHVRSPKENAFIERFNRTVSEDCIMRNRPLLRDDIHTFNETLVDWLLWYNTRRPHESLGMVPPLRYIVSTLTAGECQRYWTRTIT